MIGKVIAATALLALSTTAALSVEVKRRLPKVNAYAAAPAPVAPPVSQWSGFYVGVNGGYGFAGSSGTATGGSGLQVLQLPLGVYFSNAQLAPSAGFYGGQAGYNMQFGWLVLGIESDYQAGKFSSKSSLYYPGPAFAPTFSNAAQEQSWFGTSRLRIGGAIEPGILLYATGGLAYGKVEDRISTTGTNAAYYGAYSETKLGYSVGAGVEWQFARGWSLRGEYLYVDLGNNSLRINDTTLNPGSYVDYSLSHNMQVARGAVNYRF